MVLPRRQGHGPLFLYLSCLCICVCCEFVCLCISCVLVFINLQSMCYLQHEGGAKRVGVVRDNSTSAANLNGLHASINTAAAVQGRGVDGTLWGRLSAQSDVASLTP